MTFESGQPKIKGTEQAMIEQAKHDLVDESCLPIGVDQALKAEIRRLEQVARIRQFVPLLAIRRARELLGTKRRRLFQAA